MSNILKHAIEQLIKCQFTCDGGPLSENVGFNDIKDHAERLPAHAIGDIVWFKVTATANGVSLDQAVELYICGINAVSHCQTNLEFSYDLSVGHLQSSTPIAVAFKGVNALSISVDKPTSPIEQSERSES